MTTGEQKPVVTWTYWLPSEKGEGYAWIVMDSLGRFTTISDYGNYGYWWSSFGPGDFRDFIRQKLCTDPHYIVNKLGMDRGKVFKVAETKKAIREHIQEYVDDDKKEDELELVDVIENETSLGVWFRDTSISDVSELMHYDYSGQVYAFVEKVLPRLKRLLDAERMSATTSSSAQ